MTRQAIIERLKLLYTDEWDVILEDINNTETADLMSYALSVAEYYKEESEKRVMQA